MDFLKWKMSKKLCKKLCGFLFWKNYQVVFLIGMNDLVVRCYTQLYFVIFCCSFVVNCIKYNCYMLRAPSFQLPNFTLLPTLQKKPQITLVTKNTQNSSLVADLLLFYCASDIKKNSPFSVQSC
jgi:hypothetical protein